MSGIKLSFGLVQTLGPHCLRAVAEGYENMLQRRWSPMMVVRAREDDQFLERDKGRGGGVGVVPLSLSAGDKFWSQTCSSCQG